jgi:hypothetical protein
MLPRCTRRQHKIRMLPEEAWRRVVHTDDLAISLANGKNNLPVALILLVISCGPIHMGKEH